MIPKSTVEPQSAQRAQRIFIRCGARLAQLAGETATFTSPLFFLESFAPLRFKLQNLE